MVTFDQSRLLAISLLNLLALPDDPEIIAADTLTTNEKRSALLMACMRIAEQMLCEIGSWEENNVLEGLQALVKDMRKNIGVHCAVHRQDT
jgi:hypothetical protein